MSEEASIVDLSREFAQLAEKLVGRESFAYETAKLPKVRGMSYRTPTELPVPIYSRETIMDLANIGAGLAEASGQKDEVNKFRAIGTSATQTITEEQLLSRYADYYDALTGMATASAIMEDAAREIESVLQATEVDQEPIKRIENLLERVKSTVSDAFGRVLGLFKEAYHALGRFYESVLELLASVRTKARGLIASALHKIFQQLSALAARIVSTFFGWIALVRRIADEKGFSIGKITVTIEAFEINRSTILGHIIPIPKISTPSVSMEFTPKPTQSP